MFLRRTGARMKKNNLSLQIKEDILDWIVNVVEQKNIKLNNLPMCPYARQVRNDKRLRVVVNTEEEPLGFNYALEAYRLDPRKDVVIWANPEYKECQEKFHKFIDERNKEMVESDIWLMGFHPDDGEDADEFFYENMQTIPFDVDYTMVFIQSWKALKEASKALDDLGYYDNWTVGYYRSVVEKRESY